MPDEDKTTSDANQPAEEEADLLGGLESLLEEEGSGLDLPNDEFTENDISDLFAGVEIRIGEQTKLIREDCERSSYKLVIEEEEQKIQQDALKSTPRFN